MKRHHTYWLLTLRRCAFWMAGGLLPFFSLTGCDPEVRNTVLDGLSAALIGVFTTVIQGFFLALKAQTATTTTQPVTKAVFDSLTSWFA